MLEKVDLTLEMPKKEYKKRLDEAGTRLTDILLKSNTFRKSSPKKVIQSA